MKQRIGQQGANICFFVCSIVVSKWEIWYSLSKVWSHFVHVRKHTYVCQCIYTYIAIQTSAILFLKRSATSSTCANITFLKPDVDHFIAILSDYCNFHRVQLVFQRSALFRSKKSFEYLLLKAVWSSLKSMLQHWLSKSAESGWNKCKLLLWQCHMDSK